MHEAEQRLPQLTRVCLNLFAFMVILAVYFYTPDPAGDIKRLLIAWTAGLLSLIWVGALYWQRVGFRRPAIFLDVFVLFFAFYAVATLGSDYFRISVLEWMGFLSLFLLYVLASQVYLNEAAVTSLLKWLCAAAALAAVYAIVQKSGEDPLPWADRTSDTYTNLPATYGNPNYAAHALILLIVAAIYLFFQGWWFSVPCLVLFLFHLSQTGQRAGWLALAAAGLLVGTAWLSKRILKRSLRAAVAAMVAAVVLGIAGAGAMLAYTHARTGTPFPLDVSLLIRYQSYVSASAMLLDAPLLGHGPGVYKIGYPEYWTEFEQQWFAEELRQNAHVHNDLLELAIDGGMATAGLYVSILLLAIGFSLMLAYDAVSAQRRRTGYMLAGIFTAFAADGLFGFNLRVPVSAAIFFLLLGALEGLWLGQGGMTQDIQGTAFRRRLAGGAVAVLILAMLMMNTRVFAGEYWIQAGKAADAERDYEAALADFDAARRLAPWNWQPSRWMGLIALKQDRPELAQTHFSEAARVCPDYMLTQLDLADTKLLLAAQASTGGDAGGGMALLEEAKGHAGNMLAICPMFARGETLLGRAASIGALLTPGGGAGAGAQAAFRHEANQHFLKAIELGARNQGELYGMIASNAELSHDLDAAEAMRVRAVQVEPANQAAWSAYLKFAYEHQRFDRARGAIYAQIDRLLAMEPVDHIAVATAHLWLAQVLEKGDKNFGAADHAFQMAVQYAPLLPEVWTQFAQYAFRNERLDLLKGSIVTSCQSLEATGAHALSHVNAIHALLTHGGGAAEDATLGLLAAIRSHNSETGMDAVPAYSWAAQLLKDLIGETGGIDAAMLCRSRLNLAIIAARLNQLGTAEAGFREIDGCAAESERAVLAVHWADTLARMNRGEEAIGKLREALALFPESLDVRLGLARSLKNFGFVEEARAEYRIVLEKVSSDPQSRALIEAELSAL